MVEGIVMFYGEHEKKENNISFKDKVEPQHK